ncbi:hypothetical protein [Pseudopontixanthobacter vadosimaris]|uniref:hypothetical protein n=1 Tax=Pseudopontixanthobacter vadosimaris TaxID=2726450 RepID=UPI001473D2E7|nr:hypothetical protein [Pseudopontixanthobacter vadosimaris]
MSQIKKSVDDLIEMARGMQFTGENDKYDSVDLDDQRVRVKLMWIALSRQPTVADLDQVVADLDAEAAADLKRFIAFRVKCNERREDLRVFYVYNTADRKMIVLARDVACARYYAHAHGHLRDIKNGRVMVMRETNELELRHSGKALGRALRDGYPGVVTQVGNNVINKSRNKVYIPMTVVE